MRKRKVPRRRIVEIDTLPESITKLRVGRPTLYLPEYCDLIIEEAKKGYTLGGFAGLLGVARSTINKWAEEHPEFSEAVTAAKTILQRVWEKNALKIAMHGGSSAQATLTIFGLKNMGKNDWREETHSTQDVRRVSINVDMSPQEAEQSYIKMLRRGS